MTTQPFDMSITEMVLTLVRFGLLLCIIYGILTVIYVVARWVINLIVSLAERIGRSWLGQVIAVAFVVYVAIKAIIPMLSKPWWEAINVFK